MPTITISDREHSIILAALRHFDNDRQAGVDLSNYDEIIDADDVDGMEINKLCIHINTGPHEETYAVKALSTGHLSEADMADLQVKVKQGNGMIMERDTGFFIKLYEDKEHSLELADRTNLKHVLNTLHKEGFRMVEFDADAAVDPRFTLYGVDTPHQRPTDEPSFG